MQNVFKGTPYGGSVIGDVIDLKSITREDLYSFYKKYYVPNNATLSLAGDLDVKQAKEWIQKYFKDIPKGEKIDRPTIVEPAQKAEKRDVYYDNIQLPAVIHAYHIPAQGSKDFYAISMLAQLLSQGKSSRMQKSIVDEQQKAIAVGAFPVPTEDPGVALMFGITNMGVDINDLEKAMDAEYEIVKNELITEQEFQKLKNQVENDFIASNNKIVGIAESLADYHVYYGDADLINTEIKRYLAVTREDIQNAAKKYLVKENRTTLHYLPKSAEKK